MDIDSVYDFWANVDGFSMAADGSTLLGYPEWEKQLNGMKDSYLSPTRHALAFVATEEQKSKNISLKNLPKKDIRSAGLFSQSLA